MEATSVNNTPTSSSSSVGNQGTGTDLNPPYLQLEHSFSVFKNVVDNHLSLEVVKHLCDFVEKTRNYLDGVLQQKTHRDEPHVESTPSLQPQLQETVRQPERENISAAPPVEPPSEPVKPVTKAKARRIRASTHVETPEEENILTTSSAKVTGYGLKTREAFRAAYARVAHRVQAALVGRLGDILYPTVCTRKNCTLCLSWYLYCAITPCHPRYHCTGNGCFFGYNAHTTPNGLRLLKKYHSRVHQFPIHVCDPPTGDEYENSLSETAAFGSYYHASDAGTQKILATIGDLNAIAKEMRANGAPPSDCSSGDDSDDAIATPLAVRDPARPKRARSAASKGSGTTSSVPRRKKK